MIDEQHVFNNRYRLDTKLGEGGMAMVYRGTDTLLRRRVAVKVLREQYARDEEFVRRFYQEAESAARLSHPNIVNTYDVGREGDTYYIVMELVDGPSLGEIIAADGKLPEPVAIDYAAQICSGLAYAHRQGLLHRDVKPANILITKDDVVKLSDFGIARAMSQQTMAMTRPGVVMGSVYYMSPEQAQDHELHEASDLYSVGVLLYQMLTGKLPFTGESPVTVALKHVSDPVPVLDPAVTGVSPAIAAIVNRLLQKSPENRFQSASEVASALREARERPLTAAYTTQDDAPAQRIAAQLPPRPSRKPDRPQGFEEPDGAPASRGSGPFLWLLVPALLVAAAAGYFAFRPPAVPRVTVANYVGMSDVQAQQTILNAGLSYKPPLRVPSDTVPANHVSAQYPAPGTTLPKGGTVTLTISNGKPPVGLRDIVGFTLSDAQKDLSSDGFHVNVVHKFNAAPKDTVLNERPHPGGKVPSGSTVTLTVSDGPAPVRMPDLVGMTYADAQKLATKGGFALSVSQKTVVPNVPAGVIASQDEQPGKSIAAGSVVYVEVSEGQGATQIPDVRGMTFADAQDALKAAGLKYSVTYAESPAGPDNGTIVNEAPVPGTQADKGTAVQLWLSITGYVPDVSNMTLDAAEKTLLDYGYEIGNTTPTAEGADGTVVRTEPELGTKLDPGTPVNIYYNSPNPGQPQP
jgi:beta-lactam-binding protein with PASTA domain/tRNA A-37 threonylcarbamoyl transferase component Bud32